MRVLLSLGFLVASLGASLQPHFAFTQTETSIEQIDVAIWPEFDRQAVLIIYRVSLPEDTVFPAELRLPIPAQAGEPNAVAWGDAEGQLFDTEYDRVLEGNWAWISLQTEGPAAQIEYYQDLTFVGARKAFTFEWAGGVEIGDASYEVQVPPGATDIELTPVPDQSVDGTDGLTYLKADLGPMSAAETFSIEISYSKSSSDLTVNSIATSLPFPTAAPVVGQGGTPTIEELLPYIVVALGIGLVLVGGYLFIRYRSEQVSPASRRRSRKKSRSAIQKDGDDFESSPVFCHNCGTKAGAGDFYCRHCGTQLRR